MSIFDGYEPDGAADAPEGMEACSGPPTGPDGAVMPGEVMADGHGGQMPDGIMVAGPAQPQDGLNDDGTAVLPSEDEIAQARRDLGGPDQPAAVAPDQQAAAPPSGDGQATAAEPTDPQALEKAKQDAQESQETAQMLSQIADIRHQTAMSIIGNMRA